MCVCVCVCMCVSPSVGVTPCLIDCQPFSANILLKFTVCVCRHLLYMAFVCVCVCVCVLDSLLRSCPAHQCEKENKRRREQGRQRRGTVLTFFSFYGRICWLLLWLILLKNKQQLLESNLWGHTLFVLQTTWSSETLILFLLLTPTEQRISTWVAVYAVCFLLWGFMKSR